MERVVVRVGVLVLERDKSEADGEDRGRDSGGRWERERGGGGGGGGGERGGVFGGGGGGGGGGGNA